MSGDSVNGARQSKTTAMSVGAMIRRGLASIPSLDNPTLGRQVIERRPPVLPLPLGDRIAAGHQMPASAIKIKIRMLAHFLLPMSFAFPI
jgi:hypothetical protein